MNAAAIGAAAIVMLEPFEERLEWAAPRLVVLKIGSLAVATGGAAFCVGLTIANEVAAAAAGY